jgi:hypothetical protein
LRRNKLTLKLKCLNNQPMRLLPLQLLHALPQPTTATKPALVAFKHRFVANEDVHVALRVVEL